jgi:histone-lysine N-methyltransferase SETMAR
MTMPDPIQSKQPRREFKNYSGNFFKHPPYRPDLAPSDYYLFGPLKNHLCGKRFADDEEAEMEVQKWLRQLSKDFYAVGFEALIKRWDKCTNVGGKYVKK